MDLGKTAEGYKHGRDETPTGSWNRMHRVSMRDRSGPALRRLTDSEYSSMRLAEFVQNRFVPEYVALRESAGRAHFRAILKYILPHEQVARAFVVAAHKKKPRLDANQNWPYLDSLRLRDISPDKIAELASAALSSGYSTQTVAHIRNVVHVIFSHAIKTGCYLGENPASLVTLPAITRKQPHRLTLTQLKQIMHVMRYPERHLALLVILTDMNVAEICGLQWNYVNLSSQTYPVQEESLPSRTIAVRNKWYRGELSATGNRNRLIVASDVLCSVFQELKNRKHFCGADDFVLASRAGTPIHPENVAARRLKTIGKRFEMPWLSWHVFHRTRVNLQSELGRHFDKELENVLSLNGSKFRHSPGRSH
jgi:site-specific recombinase XerD